MLDRESVSFNSFLKAPVIEIINKWPEISEQINAKEINDGEFIKVFIYNCSSIRCNAVGRVIVWKKEWENLTCKKLEVISSAADKLILKSPENNKLELFSHFWCNACTQKVIKFIVVIRTWRIERPINNSYIESNPAENKTNYKIK